MFNKSLFKQSCKANGTMWGIITFAVCFMLCCVMLIAGNGNLGATKVAIQDNIIQGELEAQTQARAINYYEITYDTFTHFDTIFEEEMKKVAQTEEFSQILQAQGQEKAMQYATTLAYKTAALNLQQYVDQLITSQGYHQNSNEALEIKGLVFYTFNLMSVNNEGKVTYLFDSFYKNVNEEAPRYDLTTIGQESRKNYLQQYILTNVPIFLASNMVLDENIQRVLDALKDYGVTKEQYEEFGFTDYQKVKEIAISALINYQVNLNYRLENMKENETVEGIKQELSAKFSKSMLSSLPKEVSDALQEIGSSDLYGVLVGSIFFKMAGLLLPIIYMIMTANALIAGQVDSGSMAYVLSSSTKRKEVTFTQAFYLVGSLLAMFICTTITSLICYAIVDVDTGLNIGKLLLINLGAFIVMFAMSGICFLASCWFNRSKYSMSIGGGLNMFFLVATMLGLFGSAVLPSIIRMKALNAFNYVTIISLFDVVSILEGTTTFIWKLAILLVIGVICFILGSAKFEKKDLPL